MQLNYSVDTQILSDRTQIQNEIQQDYARVDVYYQTLSVKLTKERAAYPVSVMKEKTKLTNPSQTLTFIPYILA